MLPPPFLASMSLLTVRSCFSVLVVNVVFPPELAHCFSCLGPALIRLMKPPPVFLIPPSSPRRDGHRSTRPAPPVLAILI